MTTSQPPKCRQRGGIRRHGQGRQVRVSAGFDPSTGERIVLYETVPIPEARTNPAQERAEREAYKEAEKVLTRLQADADALKVGRTKATVGALLDRWMDQHEIDPTTRMTYEAAAEPAPVAEDVVRVSDRGRDRPGDRAGQSRPRQDPRPRTRRGPRGRASPGEQLTRYHVNDNAAAQSEVDEDSAGWERASYDRKDA